MIKGTFRLGGELIEVIVDGENVMFNDVATNTISTIEGLQLNKQGVMKQFPDLKDDDNWKRKAVMRFKTHIRKFKTLDARIEYVKEELMKHGYEGLYKQRAGFRPKKFR